ncbi:MAG: protein kinase domain-containing protein [Planctomycetota bacterium]|jgi:serine/threonine-protein kinase
MSDPTGPRGGDPKPDDRGQAPAPSILSILGKKLGDTARVSLHDEGSDPNTAPLIDPASEEKQVVPRGKGNFQLLGEIARGGMGVILKGHDTDLGRDIAVKVLARELAQKPETIHRFIEEAQIGGQLQHPGIVPVYELGLMADERPFFTMKLVKGRTLAKQFADRKTPETNRRRFLEIFEDICQTMAYAHSRGVIHRDLKPANVMVGAFGEVQVVDWGLAKVLGRGGVADERKNREARSDFTVLETVRSDGSSHGSDSMLGSVLGTPEYMAPEQASGLVDQLDERSDVFSLGAMLCELLTGLPPYAGDKTKLLVSAARARLEEAHQRLDDCGADEELIELTKECLLPAPAARPSDAGVVAERVHAYIDSVEERAKAARVEAAVHKRARKLTLALASTILLALAGGGSGWIWMQNERSARQLADAARRSELVAQVNEALNQATLLQGQEEWAEALAEGERAQTIALAGAADQALHSRVSEVVGEIRDQYEIKRAVEAKASDTAALMTELAEIRLPEGNIDWSQASALYAAPFEKRGLQIDDGEVDAVAAWFTERGLGAEAALVLDEWASIRRTARDRQGADRLLDLAHFLDDDPLRAQMRDAIASNDRDQLRSLSVSGIEDQPPITLFLFATALNQAGERDAAVAVYRSALKRHPNSFLLQFNAGRLLRYGPILEQEEAVQCFAAAAAIRPEAVEARHLLGYVLNDLGRYEAAARAFEEAIALDPNEGLFVYRLGWSRLYQEDLRAALALFEQALESAEGTWWAAYVNHYYARTLRQIGEPERALPHDEIAVRLRPTITQLRNGLGNTLESLGEFEGAEEAFRSSIRVEPESAFHYVRLAQVQQKMGAEDEAQSSIMRALELNPNLTFVYGARGRLYLEAGDLARAADDLRRAIELGERFPGPFTRLALLHAVLQPEDQRDFQQASGLVARALVLEPKAKYAIAVRGLIRYLQGSYPQALADLQRWSEVDHIEIVNRDYACDILNRLFLAMAMQRAGRAEEARAEYGRAVDLQEAMYVSEFWEQELEKWRSEAASLLGI